MPKWLISLRRWFERLPDHLIDVRRWAQGAYERSIQWFQEWRETGRLGSRDGRSDPNLQEVAPVITRNNEPLLGDDTLIYAIGDIHGRADLLRKLLDMIELDCAGFDGEKHIVFLGDYIDRGLQSRQVIETLIEEQDSDFKMHFIKGNHEDALLSFLADPGFGPKWAAYGGRETLVSYGVKPPRSLSLNAEWEDAHDAFLRAFPKTHQTFFLGLPTSVQIGGYAFVHAGLRPGKVFVEQNDHDLMWIRDEFLKGSSAFDVMVVHGHTPTDAPHHDHRRINVDTGAYFTGRLTAAKLTGESVDFIGT